MTTPELATCAAFRHEYRHTTRGDVAFALQVAETPAEVDAAAHLSLVLFGGAGVLAPFEDRGRAWPPLHSLVHLARYRVDGFPASLRASSERLNALIENAAARNKAEAIAARRARDARIARLGFTNATDRGARP